MFCDVGVGRYIVVVFMFNVDCLLDDGYFVGVKGGFGE